MFRQSKFNENNQQLEQIYRSYKIKNDTPNSYYKSFRSLQIFANQCQKYFNQIIQNPYLVIRKISLDHIQELNVTFEDSMMELIQDIKSMGLKDLSNLISKVVETVKNHTIIFLKGTQKLLVKAKHIGVKNYTIKNNKYTDNVQQNLCMRCMEVVQQRILDKMKLKTTKVIGNQSSSSNFNIQNNKNPISLNQDSKALKKTNSRFQLQKQKELHNIQAIIDKKLQQRKSLIDKQDIDQLRKSKNSKKSRFSVLSGLSAQDKKQTNSNQNSQNQRKIQQNGSQINLVIRKNSIHKNSRTSNLRRSQSCSQRASIFGFSNQPTIQQDKKNEEKQFNNFDSSFIQPQNKINLVSIKFIQNINAPSKIATQQFKKKNYNVEINNKQQLQKIKKLQKQIILLKIQNQGISKKIRQYENAFRQQKIVQNIRTQRQSIKRTESIKSTIKQFHKIQKKQCNYNNICFPISNLISKNQKERSSKFKISHFDRSNKTQVLNFIKKSNLDLPFQKQKQKCITLSQQKRNYHQNWKKQTIDLIKKISHQKLKAKILKNDKQNQIIQRKSSKNFHLKKPNSKYEYQQNQMSQTVCSYFLPNKTSNFFKKATNSIHAFKAKVKARYNFINEQSTNKNINER